jgi:hypothetical protein
MTKSFVLEGSEELFSALRSLIDDLDIHSSTSAAAKSMAERLRDNTPPGYSRKLPESVMFSQAAPGEFVIGYERGVESAGDPQLDSVTRPRTSGRSVLARPRREWVDADRLASVLEQTFEDYSKESVRIVSDGVSRSLA